MTPEPEQLAELAAQAALEAGGLPVDLLGDFPAVLTAAVREGVPLDARTARSYRRFGDRAARDGVALRALLDLYLSLIRRLWPQLPAVCAVDRSSNTEVTRYDLSEDASTETAMVFGELYRNGADWKFRAVGQGHSSGKAGIAQDFGVTV